MLGRPPEKGHTSEWIAPRIFDIALEASEAHKAIDGRFCGGPLAGRTVNLKRLLKREGGPDMTELPERDYYLVFTGPTATAKSSVGGTRPWLITAVYLFDAAALLAQQGPAT